MPITGIDWKDGAGHDLHLLRGRDGPALLGLLEVTEGDGTVVDAITYLVANDDVKIDFQPTFTNLLDQTANPPTCTGLGITINNRLGPGGSFASSGSIIHNFLIPCDCP